MVCRQEGLSYEVHAACTSQDLLELVRKTAPPEADVVPLSWAYEDEDYNIAIVMPDTVDHLEGARQIEDRLH